LWYSPTFFDEHWSFKLPGHYDRCVRKNKQVKRVFWTLFVAKAGLVMARVVDPVTTQQVVGMFIGFNS
jgi:hypothetical protein